MAAKRARGRFEALTAAAAEVAPGCEGQATPCPRGAFLGLSLRHGRGHMVRAVMEVVAYDLRESLECFRRAGLAAAEVRIGEGGTRSCLWRRILADVVGGPVSVIDAGDLSALGAALIAAVGTGVFTDFNSATDAAVRLGETVQASPEGVRTYEAGFRRYRQIYPALREWYSEESR